MRDVVEESVREDALVEELDDVEDEVVDELGRGGFSVDVEAVLLAEDDVVVLNELGDGDEEEDVGEEPVIDRAQVLADFTTLEIEQTDFKSKEDVVRVELTAALLELLA